MANHVDKGHGDADFALTDALGNRIFADVTEATINEDRKAIVKARRTRGTHLLGETGGRFKGGSTGSDWEEALASDVQAAIKRKQNNRYGKRSILLVYPNSNVGFADTAEACSLLKPLSEQVPFEIVFVCRKKELIVIDHASVSFEGSMT